MEEYSIKNELSQDEKFQLVNNSLPSSTRANFARICFLTSSTSVTFISTFSFLFSETAFVFLYTRLPNSSLKRRTKIHIHTWQLPALAESFNRSTSFLAPSALHFCNMLCKLVIFPRC